MYAISTRIKWLMLLLIALQMCSAALAQNTTELIKQIESNSEFDAVFTMISRKRHIAFICEGEPLHQKLSSQQIDRIRTALADPRVSTEESLKVVASAFDYDLTFLKEGLCLLSKRYSDPEDLPLITFEEASKSLGVILNLIEQFRPYNEFQAVAALYKTLSDAQKQELAKGVPISTLSPEQQVVVARLAASRGMQNLADIQSIGRRLICCKTQATFFTRNTVFGNPVACYKVPISYNGPNAVEEIVLGRWIYSSVGGAIMFAREPGLVDLQDGKLVSTRPDPTTPLARPEIREKSRFTLSLSEIASQFTESLEKQSGAIRSVIVDDALARKPVLIIGQINAPITDLVQGIGKLYNLRVSRPNTRTLRLTFLTPHELRGPDEVGAEILRLLPAPISRFALSRADMPWEHYTVAIRRLRQIVEPEIDKRDTGKVPFPETTDEARDLVAISSLLTCMPAINRLQVPVSPFVQNISAGKISLVTSPADTSYQTHIQFDIWCQLKGKTYGTSVNMVIHTNMLNP